MKCGNCGRLLVLEDDFCPNCGCKILKTTNQITNNQVIKKYTKKSNGGKILIIILSIIILFLLIVALLLSVGTNSRVQTNNAHVSGNAGSEYNITDGVVENNNITDNSTRLRKRVIMIYMVGSNLESTAGAASTDINEMLSANVDKNTKIYVYTGGANSWVNPQIDAATNNIYEIKNKKLKLVKSLESTSMGMEKTLTTFINYVTDITKSNNYSLILWDHGGGPIGGYGYDEVHNDMMYLDELYSSLKNTKFNSNNKLEFIGFDACLMANIEIASYLSNFSKYLIASEEIEPGSGWDYETFSNISRLSTENLGKKIIDRYAEQAKYAFNIDGFTLSLIKLDRIPKVVDKLNKSFSKMNVNLSKKYENVARTRISTLEFGKSTPDKSFDLIDIVNFLDIYKDNNLNGLKKSIEDVVVYNKTNLSGARGLSIYFPYTNNVRASNFLNQYSYFSNFSGYYKFIFKFHEIRNGDNRKSWDFLGNKASFDVQDSNLSIELTEDQIKNYSKAYYIVFEKNEDGTYTPIYKNTNFKQVGNKLISQYDKKKLYVFDGKDKGTTTIIHVKDTNKGSLYYAPVITIRYGVDGIASEEFSSSNGWVRLLIKNDKVKELGIVPDIKKDVLSQSAKQIWELKDWNSIQFTNFRYYILDDNGNYTFNWKSADNYYLFEVLPRKNKISFKMDNLDKSKEYYAVINVLDMQGNNYSTNLIKVQ